MRVTPTDAARASASSTGSAGSSRPRAMSRWQWLSTTGCGSGSGSAGRSEPCSRAVHRVVDDSLGHPRAAGHVDDGLLAGHAVGLVLGDQAARIAGSVTASAGSAPSTTMVTSPRTPGSAQPTSSASVPRRTSSWVLVSSRQTAPRRSGPNTSAIAFRVAWVRCGASKKTRVRSSPATAASRRARSPRLAWQEALEAEPVDRQSGDRERGQHRGGAGDAGHRDVVLDGGRDQAVAGVGDARHPGVGHQHHPVAGQQGLEQRLGPQVLVALEVGDDPTRDLDARGRWPADAAGGCPRRPRRRQLASSAPSRGGASSTRPIGVAASTSVPVAEEVAGVVMGPIMRSRSIWQRDPPRPARAHDRALAHGGGRRRTERSSAWPVARTRPRPRARLGGHRCGHLAGRVPPAVGPRQAARVPLRRDVLRQGRVVADALRLLAELRRQGQRRDPRRAHRRALDRRPEHGRAPRGRQVADRPRRDTSSG